MFSQTDIKMKEAAQALLKELNAFAATQSA